MNVKRDPELTDGCIETWRRLSPTTPTTLADRRNQRGHMYRHLWLLERHGYAKRVCGGYITNQLSLDIDL